MRLFFAILDLIAMVSCLPIATYAESPRPPEIAAIEAENLARRSTIRSGHVELHSSLALNSGLLAGQVHKTNCHIYFDGKQLRGDYWEQYRASGTGKKIGFESRYVVCSIAHGVFRQFYVPDTAEIRPEKDPLAVLRPMPDPRMIGLVLGDIQTYRDKKINDICESTAWEFVEESGREVFRGKGCRKWKYRFVGTNPWVKKGESVFRTVWISDKEGKSVVGMEQNWSMAKESMECDLMELQDIGFYPTFVKYSRWDQDGKLDRTEELNVKVHQFNEPLGDEFFDFQGMGVPLGHTVYDYNTKKLMKLTASGLEPQENSVVD